MPAVVPTAPRSDDPAQIWKTLEDPSYNGYFALQNVQTGKLLTARTSTAASFQGWYISGHFCFNKAL